VAGLLSGAWSWRGLWSASRRRNARKAAKKIRGQEGRWRGAGVVIAILRALQSLVSGLNQIRPARGFRSGLPILVLSCAWMHCSSQTTCRSSSCSILSLPSFIAAQLRIPFVSDSRRSGQVIFSSRSSSFLSG